MNLFTSSSNRLAVKALILFLISFIFYSTLLEVANPKVMFFQNQWVRNYAVAEGFIYQASSASKVIVGSSMAAKLKQRYFSETNIYNLSFEGGSSLTGLRIIKKSNILPQAIYIETNIIERKANERMLNSLFTPVLWKVKKHIISLQYTYQPINIALTFLNKRFGNNAKNLHARPNKTILKFGVKRHLGRENETKSLDNEDILEQKKLVDYFVLKGVNIIFFQMPVHEEILSTKGYQKRKKILQTVFSPLRFHWIDRNHHYETTDGIHLNAKSAMKFASVLKAEMSNNF